jgi:hypothetical protein
MQTPNLPADISVLEEQLAFYKNLLDKAFSDNLQFSETKVIFHEMKKIADKLEAVRNKNSG